MASYPYEQLNDESFQHLSQSLLVKEFPGLQCFPVGQPDGGRDATFPSFEAASDTSGFNLFQVKFSKRVRGPSEARRWLLETLKKELPKVRTQITRGAQRFVLITNVSGSAHPDVGTIDELQALLEKHIPIPAQAWWRDDIDRRLDDAWDLKFAHPVLFTGTDFLRLVVEASPSEDRERRKHAITAFLSDQFQSDREVKFKQVDLENDLFDLFTDVPLVPRNNPFRRRQKAAEQLMAAFRRAASSPSGEVDSAWIHRSFDLAWGSETRFGGYFARDEAWLGTASILLDRDFQEAEPLVILEGAPGQGKSTIAQYICQVHRTRFLPHEDHGAIDSAHLGSSLRLPFKVELRDFATWLSGSNPFETANGGDTQDASPSSLEGFLSALVRYSSGGSAFNVSDLQATLSSSPALIVLDGLDEVAEIKHRQRVVEEITAAATRLKSLASSLQVVITTRPTPFINSAVLPSDTFATYSLESLTRPLITQYADRWLTSRDIDESDANDVRQILDTKLDEPHLRDLARNPMQLAILLSLIHRRGVSLPDKRTALYDNYIDIFFDRESEKAAVVKENRELLIRIHRYLAWILQSGAEMDSGTVFGEQTSGTSLSGSIAEQELKALLGEFLKRDESDPSLVERLFGGVVERVVAIVSRVPGTYEFDVQTLREYFAARHLYETAPYSPVGSEHRGTKTDRWRALSRNFYWLNVARFYAGCYSEGELASLVDDLGDLSDDQAFSCTSHPQLLTATLLRDWVFSQRPRAIQGAVNLLLEPRRLRMLVAGAWSGHRQLEEVLVRDPACRRRLIAACKELIGPNLSSEQVMDVVRSVLLPNSEPKELFDWWMEELCSAGKEQARQWCVIGELLHCWSIVDLETAKGLLDRENVPAASVISALLHVNRMDILEGDEELFQAAVESVLAGERVGWSRDGSLLQQLAGSLEPIILSVRDARTTFGRRLSLREYRAEVSDYAFDKDINSPSFPEAERCARVVQAFTSAAEGPVEEWSASIEPWDQLIQRSVSEFGERTAFVDLANIAAGIRSKEEQCQDSPDLFDCQRPLVRRARYARLRAGSRKWWSNQLSSAASAGGVRTALLLFATWAGAKTIEELAREFDTLVVSLEASEWHDLHSSLRKAVDFNSDRPWLRPLAIRVSSLPPTLSYRTVALFAERCPPATQEALYESFLKDFKGDDSVIVSLRTEILVRRALRDEANWPEALEGLRSSYSLGAPTVRALFPHMGHIRTLPAKVAREVVDRPLEFPGVLVGAAEARCRQLDADRIVPVGRVETDEGWFTE